MSLFYPHQNDVHDLAGRGRFNAAVSTAFEFFGRVVAAAKANWRERRAAVLANLPDEEPLQSGLDQSRDPVRDARRFPLAPVILGEKWDF